MKNISDLIEREKIPYLIAEIGINHNGDIQRSIVSKIFVLCDFL